MTISPPTVGRQVGSGVEAIRLRWSAGLRSAISVGFSRRLRSTYANVLLPELRQRFTLPVDGETLCLEAGLRLDAPLRPFAVRVKDMSRAFDPSHIASAVPLRTALGLPAIDVFAFDHREARLRAEFVAPYPLVVTTFCTADVSKRHRSMYIRPLLVVSACLNDL